MRRFLLGALPVGVLIACQEAAHSPRVDQALELTEFRTLASGEQVPDVRDAVPGPDGGVWVLSSYDPFVALIDAEGNTHTRFGSRGEGPGELRNPWYLAQDPQGVAVVDVGARELKRFSAAGEFLEATPLPPSGAFVLGNYREMNFGQPLRVHRVEGGWLFETYSEGQVTNPGDLWRGRLVAAQDGEPDVEVLLQYDSLLTEPVGLEIQLFAMAPLWSSCGPGAAFLNPLTSQLLRLQLDGASKWMELPLPLQRFEPRFVDQYADRVVEHELREQGMTVAPEQRSEMRRMVRAQMEAVAPDVAPFTKLLCDPDDRVWVAGFGLETDARGYGRTWQVFDGDEMVASVTFPERVVPLFIERDRVVAVRKDSLDVEHLIEFLIDDIG